MENENRSDNMDIINNNPNMSNYFRYIANKETDKEASRLIAQKIHSKFSDVFTGIMCFKGTFKLQVREGIQRYQVSARRVVYMIQEQLKEELERLQKQHEQG